MNCFALTPQDAWFFRDGRPYNHGESNQADVESVFPPPARTITGALRAALARANGWDGKRGTWPQEVTTAFGDGPNNLGQLQFIGPFLIKDNQPLWPLPRHLLGKAESGKCTSATLGVDDVSGRNLVGKAESRKWAPKTFLRPTEQPTETDQGSLRLPEIPHSVTDRDGLKPAESAWITRAGLEAILKGGLPAADTLAKPSELWRLEARIGLRRDPATLTVGEGDLYSPVYVRLCKGVSLGVGFSGLPFGMSSLPKLFPLGGESRLAQCEPWPGNPLPSAPEANAFPADARGQVRFIILLLTPGRLDPDKPPLDGAELVSACVGKPLFFGGWDSLKHEPLPLEPFLPAGSVWFCQAAAERLPEILRHHGRWLGRHTAHGFGQIAIGLWPSAK
jgi:CRISPR-associated protein Cmr3